MLAQVLRYVEQGWPTTVDNALAPYSSRRNELSLFQDCLMWGSRVIVPEKARSTVLLELHEGHPGMTRMKALARMYVWWPLLDKDIEQSVRQCHLCQQQHAAPAVAPLDFAGPVQGKMILVVIDSHSKWIEAFPTDSATSHKVIELSHTLFA